MKIEKISDTQIRFTLTKEDLAQRQMKLSELAYGTEKARRLFHDMLMQASAQFGFDATDYPLMIEAVPMAGDNIVLIVTKVQNPEELDTRFSSFSPALEESAHSESNAPASALDQLIDSIRSSAAGSEKTGDVQGAQAPGQNGTSTTPDAAVRAQLEKLREYLLLHRLYCFASLDDAITAASKIQGSFTGTSDLLQDTETGEYDLFLTMKDIGEVSSMQNVLAVLSEYGRVEVASCGREQHILEHARVIAMGNALETLSQI